MTVTDLRQRAAHVQRQCRDGDMDPQDAANVITALLAALDAQRDERLQGTSWRLPDGEWADGHTCLCGNNKGRSVAPPGEEPCSCPDGPRYRALGNSVAVPVIEWCFQRMVEAGLAEVTP